MFGHLKVTGRFGHLQVSINLFLNGQLLKCPFKNFANGHLRRINNTG